MNSALKQRIESGIDEYRLPEVNQNYILYLFTIEFISKAENVFYLLFFALTMLFENTL